MPIRSADATWNGTLKDGDGSFATQSGAVSGAYSFSTRFEDGSGTNPEELVAAAHASCFSMALSNELAKAGHEPQSVTTSAKVVLEKGDTGFGITRIDLVTTATVAGIDDEAFQELATATSKACPISKALAAVEITLSASLA